MTRLEERLAAQDALAERLLRLVPQDERQKEDVMPLPLRMQDEALERLLQGGSETQRSTFTARSVAVERLASMLRQTAEYDGGGFLPALQPVAAQPAEQTAQRDTPAALPLPWDAMQAAAPVAERSGSLQASVVWHVDSEAPDVLQAEQLSRLFERDARRYAS